MENEEEYSSDSSDEDYVPTELNGLSEEEDSGDAEDGPLDDPDDGPVTGKRKKKQSSKSSKRRGAIILTHKRKGGIHLDEAAPTDEKKDSTVENNRTSNLDVDEENVRLAEAIAQEKEEKRKMEEKKKEDLLWADFMKDTKQPVKPKASSSTNITSSVAPSNSASCVRSCTTSASTSSEKLDCKPDAKVEIVKEFKFAGEMVKMSTMVDSNSKEAKQELIKGKTTDLPRPATSSATPSPLPFGSRRPAVGGLSSVLGKIDKTPKMSTLVKSKLDWDGFKSAEGIDDELKIHNRGKSGYLERQAFLERTDHRQFEIEKSLRLSGSKQK